jgi:hypothetical protein
MAQLVETAQLSFTNSGDAYYTFGLDLGNPATGNGVQHIMLRASADCYVDFDKAVVASGSNGSFKMLAADTSLMAFDFTGGSIMKVHAQGVSGSGVLFILGIRS